MGRLLWGCVRYGVVTALLAAFHEQIKLHDGRTRFPAGVLFVALFWGSRPAFSISVGNVLS